MTDASGTSGSASGQGEAFDDEALTALVKLGIDPEIAAEHVSRADPVGAVFDTLLLPGRRERTVTATEIAAQGGLSVEQIGDLMEAMGLGRPRGEEPAFTPEEARVLVELGDLGGLWPAESRIQVARAYGAMLAGIARAELQSFQMYTEPHVRAVSSNPAEELRGTKGAFERLLPLADPFLLGVHRRWLEHELAQRAIATVEREAGTAELPGAVEVTFAFCDIKDFTAYAESSGEAAAIRAIDRFFGVVGQERGRGQLVKSLGDGAMLCYGEPADAVTAAARVIGDMRENGLPGVHASVHRGLAIARSGDYFGSTVNTAARLLAFAGRDQLLATAAVVTACGPAFEWEPAGQRVLRGISEPLEVYTLRS